MASEPFRGRRVWARKEVEAVPRSASVQSVCISVVHGVGGVIAPFRGQHEFMFIP